MGVVHLDSFVAGRSTAPNAVLCTHLVVASLRCHVTGATRRVLASSTTTGEGRGGMRRGSDGDGRPVRSASHDSEGRWCHCSAVGSRAAVRHSAGLQPTGTPPPSRRVSVLRFARRGDGAESSEPCAPGCEILSRTYSWPCRRGGRDVRRHRASPEFTRRLSTLTAGCRAVIGYVGPLYGARSRWVGAALPPLGLRRSARTTGGLYRSLARCSRGGGGTER